MNIRQEVLFDYIKSNVDDCPPPLDMWRDWSEESQNAERSAKTGLNNARL